MKNLNFEKVIQLCEKRGFFYRTAEIYGGIEGMYDFGILGHSLKLNILNLWRRDNIQRKKNINEIEGAKILPLNIWKNSGHVELFSDRYRECKNCNKRFTDISKQCLNCGSKDLTEERLFESMFKVSLGENTHTFLPPEISQSTFLNFNNFIKKNRMTLPFGIAQVGKAYRNEITPKHFIFKTKEFYQMEIEHFMFPQDAEIQYSKIAEERLKWYTDALKIPSQHLRLNSHKDDDLAHYSKSTVDVEFKFDFNDVEYGEIEGISHRGDYDLLAHSKNSNTQLFFFDNKTNKKIIPHIIETSAGLNRIVLAVLVAAYKEEEINGKERVVLKLDDALSPYNYAVLPLVKDEKLIKLSEEVFNYLIDRNHRVSYDISGSIGRRYRRQDEIGTPKCVTIDFQSLIDNTITVRDRDTLEQIRLDYKSLSMKDK